MCGWLQCLVVEGEVGVLVLVGVRVRLAVILALVVGVVVVAVALPPPLASQGGLFPVAPTITRTTTTPRPFPPP